MTPADEGIAAVRRDDAERLAMRAEANDQLDAALSSMDRFWRRQKFNDMVFAIERMHDYEELKRLKRVVAARMDEVAAYHRGQQETT
tara:strand:- start:9488 stop:9748 length:261 start_codon:yes stop_codon:yes gene_type:complete